MKKLLSKSVKKVKKGGLSRLLNKNATKNSTVIVFIKEWGATTTTGEGVYLLGTQSVYAYCNIFSYCTAMHEYFITVDSTYYYNLRGEFNWFNLLLL